MLSQFSRFIAKLVNIMKIFHCWVSGRYMELVTMDYKLTYLVGGDWNMNGL